MTTLIEAAGRRLLIRDREDWQVPSKAVTGPDPFPDEVHTAVAHYPGAGAAWVPPLDTASFLRFSQDLYLLGRGHSLGYGFVIGVNPVDWDADPTPFDVWEVRGVDIKNAANNGDKEPWKSMQDPNWNGRSTSIQVMCSDAHPPTGDQLLQFRYMLAWLDTVYGEKLALQEHGRSDFTDCAGPLNQFIPVLAVRPLPPLPPPPPIPIQEDDMPWRVAKQLHDGPWFIGDGTEAFTVGDTGHDVSTIEAEIRMATGAVNVARYVFDDATTPGAGPKIVRSFDDVKRPMQKKYIRQYVGANPALE